MHVVLWPANIRLIDVGGCGGAHNGAERFQSNTDVGTGGSTSVAQFSLYLN
jgi:pseudouridine-5'-phosphate glycosidase